MSRAGFVRSGPRLSLANHEAARREPLAHALAQSFGLRARGTVELDRYFGTFGMHHDRRAGERTRAELDPRAPFAPVSTPRESTNQLFEQDFVRQRRHRWLCHSSGKIQ